MPVRDGIEDDLPANDDRMYVLEVSRVVVEIFDGNPLVPDGVCYSISEWSPFRPPTFGGKPREIAWGQRNSETEEGVFWGVVTRENTPRFGPTRVDVFPTRDEAIRYMEAVEPECPLHSLRGRPVRPRSSLSDYREWVAANGWAPSYVAPVPESDVGVHVLPSPFSIPDEWDDAIHWRMAPRGSRHMLESTIQSSIGSGQFQSPWAVIVLDHAYRLTGRFLATRGDASEIRGIGRTSPGGRGADRLRGFLVSRKGALADAAGRCELFHPAWEMLERVSERDSWLCFPPPLPADWTLRHEALDAELHERVKGAAISAP